MIDKVWSPTKDVFGPTASWYYPRNLYSTRHGINKCNRKSFKDQSARITFIHAPSCILEVLSSHAPLRGSCKLWCPLCRSGSSLHQVLSLSAGAFFIAIRPGIRRFSSSAGVNFRIVQPEQSVFGSLFACRKCGKKNGSEKFSDCFALIWLAAGNESRFRSGVGQ